MKTYSFILYKNVEHNNDFIMACIIKFCKIDSFAAEQCILIMNNANKCFIKIGSKNELCLIKHKFDKLNFKSKIKEYVPSNVHE